MLRVVVASLVVFASVVFASVVLASCDEPSTGRQKITEVNTPDEPTKTTSPPAAGLEPCTGDGCLVVPEGIAGTVFGMDAVALKERFKRLRKRTLKRRRVAASPSCTKKQRPPETRYHVKTMLGGENAVCVLDVLDDDGLVQIACDLHGRRDRMNHAEVANVLYRSLAKQYGAPPSANQDLVNSGTMSAEWKSDAASLTVRARHRGKRSSIWLTNRSAKLALAHERELSALAADCDAKVAERKAKAADREARLLEKAKKFEEDLRPPLEQPR